MNTQAIITGFQTVQFPGGNELTVAKKLVTSSDVKSGLEIDSQIRVILFQTISYYSFDTSEISQLMFAISIKGIEKKEEGSRKIIKIFLRSLGKIGITDHDAIKKIAQAGLLLTWHNINGQHFFAMYEETNQKYLQNFFDFKKSNNVIIPIFQDENEKVYKKNSSNIEFPVKGYLKSGYLESCRLLSLAISEK